MAADDSTSLAKIIKLPDLKTNKSELMGTELGTQLFNLIGVSACSRFTETATFSTTASGARGT
jgi:hypothetical protein